MNPVQNFLDNLSQLYVQSQNPLAINIASELSDLSGNFSDHPTPPPYQEELDEIFLDESTHPILKSIEPIYSLYSWKVPETLKLPTAIEQALMFCQIVGPDAPNINDKIRLGLYLQRPNMDYPAHWHEAEEVYTIVGGNASWSIDHGISEMKKPGDLVFHSSNQPHAMQTFEKPLFAVWAWWGNLDRSTYQIEM